jgi:hypothetical protein
MNEKEIETKWAEIEKKLNESTKELYGDKGFKPESEPLHKGAKVETGKEGAEEAAEEFDASKKMETAPENNNKEGASEAHHVGKGFEGKKGAAGENDGVDRKEGAAGGAEISKKGYAAASFREKVRGVFGLSLDDKLNKPNAGKQGLAESQKKNLSEERYDSNRDTRLGGTDTSSSDFNKLAKLEQSDIIKKAIEVKRNKGIHEFDRYVSSLPPNEKQIVRYWEMLVQSYRQNI